MMASEGSEQRSAMPPPAVVPRPGTAYSSNVMDVDMSAGQDPSTIASSSKETLRPKMNVDAVSRVESDLALLLQIMSSSLHYIANRSAHVQLNEAIPLFQPVSGQAISASRGLLDRATMAENIEELTDDLLAKAKDMERHIAMLPGRRETVAATASSSAVDTRKSVEATDLDAPLASRRTRRGSRQKTEEVERPQPRDDQSALAAQHQAHDEDQHFKAELREIDAQMRTANGEYRDALQEARTLKTELDGLLRHVCDEQQSARAWLADATTQQADQRADQRALKK